MRKNTRGEEMSYVEYLVCLVLVASALVGGALFCIGWLIVYLIKHKGDI